MDNRQIVSDTCVLNQTCAKLWITPYCSGESGAESPSIPRLNVAPEEIMSPIAHSPMTLSPLATA